MALTVSWKKYRNADDEALLKEFQENKNLDVLGILYQRYMHLVFGVCMKYLQEKETAEDAVTHIFEKLIVELPRHEVDNFKSWLYVLTKNHCLMQLRSVKSEQKKMEGWQYEQESFMESAEEVHPIDEEERSLDSALKECIEKLKSEQKQCIRLFYYESKSYKEVADALKLEEKKVKSYIQNGKRNLKICIEERHDKRA